ncbi:MAG: hypothetical protein IJS26_01875 [Alphaproteobacteria bacterium]|nr:hypothetical protein [Alphaproteobacteria bacterium]
MANTYLEVSKVNHNFEEYSVDKLHDQLARMYALNEESGKEASTAEEKEKYEWSKKEIERYEAFLADEQNAFADEISVLLRVQMQSALVEEGADRVLTEIHNISYRKPDVEPEEYDVAGKTEQLELRCTFEDDGTTFGLSALKRGDGQMMGQISIDEDVIKNQDEEKFARIMEFCHKYGFSTFGLDLPRKNGEIDVDEKLKELMEKYLENQAKLASENPGPKPSENDDTGYDPAEYHVANKDEMPPATKARAKKPAKKPLSFEELCENMRNYLEKDLFKERGFTYWEHTKTIGGRKTHVFSVYDKRDPDNYNNDGRPDPKNPKVFVPTYAYRLYVSQDKDGKFYFGYATPGRKAMDAGILGDFVGEMKKTGITHLNLVNIPNADKMNWLIACAEKGIVPTGVSVDMAKAEKMLAAAKAKLTTQGYADFEMSLMEQMEENAASKGKELEISEKEYIRKHKNEAKKLLEKQQDLLEAATFEQKFENFRKAYEASDGLYNMVTQEIRDGALDTDTGAATAISAVFTLARTFDVVMGDDHDLETTFGNRLDYLLKNPKKNKDKITQIRLTDEEKNALSTILPNTKIKDLTQKDWLLIYSVLSKRQKQYTDARIDDMVRKSEASNTKRAPSVLLGDLWNSAVGQQNKINETLTNVIGLEKGLKLPDRHFNLPYDHAFEIIAEEKAKKDEAAKAAEGALKAGAVKTSAERGSR